MKRIVSNKQKQSNKKEWTTRRWRHHGFNAASLLSLEYLLLLEHILHTFSIQVNLQFLSTTLVCWRTNGLDLSSKSRELKWPSDQNWGSVFFKLRNALTLLRRYSGTQSSWLCQSHPDALRFTLVNCPKKGQNHHSRFAMWPTWPGD